MMRSKPLLNKDRQPLPASPAAWRMPRELDRYLPREVQWSPAGWVLSLLSFALLIAAVVTPALLWNFGERSAAQITRLQSEGIRADAVVVETGWARGEQPRRRFIRYRYEVGGRSYSRQQRLRPRESRSIGDLMPIRYLPEAPETAWVVGYEPRIVPEWLGLLMGAVLLFPILPLRYVLRRQSRLLSEGRATEARVIQSKKVLDGESSYQRVEYEFRALSGATRRVIVHASLRAVVAPGSSATLLYDPDDPNRFAIYPLSLVRVRPPG